MLGRVDHVCGKPATEKQLLPKAMTESQSSTVFQSDLRPNRNWKSVPPAFVWPSSATQSADGVSLIHSATPRTPLKFPAQGEPLCLTSVQIFLNAPGATAF